MWYIVDEDLSTEIARIGRRLTLDIVSVHEIGREGWTDEQQLVRAATENRCMVTGNGRDFEYLTRLFYAEGRPHAGVIIVQGALRYADPAAVAHALLRFDRNRRRFPMAHACEYLHTSETNN